MSDILDYIRAKLAAQPHVLLQIDPVLSDARSMYGGDEVYIRKPIRQTVSRRTIQRRNRATNHP